MNKNILIASSITVLVVIIVASFALSNGNKPQNPDTQNIAPSAVQETEEIEISDQLQEASENENELSMPKSAISYKISEGSKVIYKVRKEAIGKPTEEVVGVNTNISGTGWFDFESGTGLVEATFDIGDFSTGDTKRDAGVNKLFDPTEIRVSADAKELASIISGADFELDLPIELTINGVTKTVTFKLNGQVTEKRLTSKGSAQILMTDFNITPPSITGVSKVAEDMILEFDIVADPVSST